MEVKTTAPAKEAAPAPTEREYRGFSVESSDAEDGSEVITIKALWLEPEGVSFRRYTPAVGKAEVKALRAEEDIKPEDVEAARQKAVDRIVAMPEFAIISTAIMNATKDA